VIQHHLALTRDDLGDWFEEHAIAVIAAVVIATIAIYLVRWLTPHVLRPAVARQMAGRPESEVRRRADTLSSVIVRTAEVVIIALALFTILPEFGLDIRPVLAGVGITGIAIGLGAQSLVRDTINGLFILTENQYGKGDIVTIAGVTGTVEDVTLRRTLLRDVDGVLYSIPNSAVVVSANFTRDFANVRVTIPVHVSSNLEDVRRVIDDVGKQLAAEPAYRERVLTPPRFLRVDGIDGNGMSVQVNGTVRPGTQWEIAGVLRERVMNALQAAGIKTPWG